ncbi:MAG: hypothetical protein M3527_10375 [Actinomycetota bacterium]|nr:hypothetical protein [Acidimicrobiia bacterium]MDQ3294833.1 hypothetical protein [Actinomycetota bacterium]
MHFTYLAEQAHDGDDPWHVLALPIRDEGDDDPDDGAEPPVAAYALDLADGTEWTPWFVDVPAAAVSIEEDEVRRLAAGIGLPPGADGP